MNTIIMGVSGLSVGEIPQKRLEIFWTSTLDCNGGCLQKFT
ncbi:MULTISPECIES: hypothetical protein [Arthrospira]|nr:hypothetical protein [Arthrospira platensis]MDF2208141.1 hypothetical protein [Arthrospira platensis NCB002]MDT9184762.1 hypothetical protein [Limnospira sp. PMC 289.06]MDT9295275.1 hypothetical protein [Arthrospira platensis PCC 7345]MDT9310930.1 hypothetical protein [Limnospira sp. Paracas R14]WAK74022.1 hypothetical protein AP9108_36440 [Arthrospira sp. PCC 9108]